MDTFAVVPLHSSVSHHRMDCGIQQTMTSMDIRLKVFFTGR